MEKRDNVLLVFVQVVDLFGVYLLIGQIIKDNPFSSMDHLETRVSMNSSDMIKSNKLILIINNSNYYLINV